MTTENTYVTIASLPQSMDSEFMESVKSFALTADSLDLNLLQRDGATAIIDLAMQFGDRGYNSDIELIAQVVGRLQDVQVRDFALGSHSEKSFDTYWNMWLYLLRIAPVGFVAPIACLFATLAYERGESELSFRTLDRATAESPTYPLTILLRRVFTSDWPSDAFAAMRVELHPKVTAGIFNA
jgi:hypothetical protein